MRRITFLALVAPVLLVAVVLCAQQPPAGQSQQQRPTFRAATNVVRVDVIVTGRNGAPVADLQASDFEVSEDGRPQSIDTFRFVEVREQPGAPAPREIRSLEDEATEAARDDVRLLVILLDDLHMSNGGAVRARPALERFVTREVGPSDLIALTTPLAPTSTIGFTRDKSSVLSRIQKFLPRPVDGPEIMGSPAEVSQVRNEVTMSSLKGLAIHLGTLREGRKAILLVSEGFGLEAREFGDMSSVLEAANRNNTAIYTLDPRGLSFANDSWTQDTLRTLADNTDGRAIVNTNDFDAGLQQVVRDLSAYYLIGYTSNASQTADGRFHEIKVRVKRPGLQARARKGYWAPTAEERAREMAPAKPEAPAGVTRARSTIAEAPRGMTIRTWLGTSRGDRGRTRVTFVWEPAPPPAGTILSDLRAARVALVASGPSGEPYFSGRAPDGPLAPPAATPGSPVAGRTSSRLVFDVPPGRMRLKLSVEGADTHVIETDAREVDVPDFSAPAVTLSTPAVFAARTVREFRALASEGIVPTAERRFSRTERLLVRFEARGPGDSTPQVAARTLNRNGQEMAVLAVQPDAARAHAYTIDLPLAGFPPSEYLIEITAKGESGEAKQIVAIRATG